MWGPLVIGHTFFFPFFLASSTIVPCQEPALASKQPSRRRPDLSRLCPGRPMLPRNHLGRLRAGLSCLRPDLPRLGTNLVAAGQNFRRERRPGDAPEPKASFALRAPPAIPHRPHWNPTSSSSTNSPSFGHIDHGSQNRRGISG